MTSCQDAQVIQGCHNGITPVSIHYIYGKDAAGLTVLNTVITDAAGTPIAGANASNTIVGACLLQPKKFRDVRPLNVGANTINHNLAFTASNAAFVEVRDDTTGELIATRVSNELANSLAVTITVSVLAARITIF